MLMAEFLLQRADKQQRCEGACCKDTHCFVLLRWLLLACRILPGSKIPQAMSVSNKPVYKEMGGKTRRSEAVKCCCCGLSAPTHAHTVRQDSPYPLIWIYWLGPSGVFITSLTVVPLSVFVKILTALFQMSALGQRCAQRTQPLCSSRERAHIFITQLSCITGGSKPCLLFFHVFVTSWYLTESSEISNFSNKRYKVKHTKLNWTEENQSSCWKMARDKSSKDVKSFILLACFPHKLENMDHIIISLCSGSLLWDEKAKEMRKCVIAISSCICFAENTYEIYMCWNVTRMHFFILIKMLLPLCLLSFKKQPDLYAYSLALKKKKSVRFYIFNFSAMCVETNVNKKLSSAYNYWLER